MGNIPFLLFIFNSFIVFLNLFISGGNGETNPYRHIETLDRAQTYQLEWIVDWTTERINFTVTAKTNGWVGFGLSKKGKMNGADIIMGGVDKDGKPYFEDMHGVENAKPLRDSSQDWTLHSASESNNQTTLTFSRAIDTCDDQDFEITEDLTVVIWAFGENDNTSIYHFNSRGRFDAYLLSPDLAPRPAEDERIKNGTSETGIKVFTLNKETRLLPQDTQYFCTFHKVPLSPGKKHIVGFNVTFPTDLDRRHTHHIILHRCRPPPATTGEEFFGQASRTGGSECYLLDRPNPLPVPYCREVIFLWGVNGKAIFFPEHAGLPVDTTVTKDEYFMFQAHYDNPNSQGGIPVTIDLDIYYSENVRENDVGVLQLGILQPGSTTILIPPMSSKQSTYGHCSSECTERMFPNEQGIKIFAAFLHTHLSGIGVRSRHIRNDVELKWIVKDDNYFFDFQQFKVFREEVTLLPRDQIVVECSYDSTERNGTTLSGGFSTREEMCTNFMYYYSHSPGFSICRGEIRTEEYNYGLLGIKNMTWNQSIRKMVITDPPELAGLTVGDHLNTNIEWNLAMRAKLTEMQKYEPQVSHCPRFYWDDPQEQIRNQLESGILERTGRLPGSDGQVYTSVDEDYNHPSQLSRTLKEYIPPPRQCSGIATK